MNNDRLNFNNVDNESKNLKEYYYIVRNNILPFISILIISSIAAIIYAIKTPDIFVSTTSIKITKIGSAVLQSEPFEEFAGFNQDRFINNEIEILKSYNLRELVARALLDSIQKSSLKINYKSLYVFENENNKRALNDVQIIELLSAIVGIEQRKGLDIINISAESPTPAEASLIASVYANIYRTYNLEINRNQLTGIRKFLDEQRKEKQEQLRFAEDTLTAYQEKGGIVSLDEQAKALIAQISDFESKLNAAKISLVASNEMLFKYKEELSKQDPRLADYLESVTSETYITALQKQISEFQLNKDLALARFEPSIDISQKVKEYDAKIKELQNKLDEKIKIMKSGILASSPEAVRSLSQKIIEEEVKNRAFESSVQSLSKIVSKYEERFNKLPKTTLNFARFERTRESTAKLYTLIEEKYQEAMINEQAQPGNVLIIDNARIPTSPSKPNRKLIIITGVLIGLVLALGFVFVRTYFDNTIKTPEDIEKKNAYVLAWIPKVGELNGKSGNGADFIIERFPTAVASESIRALRTRVQFSKMHKENLKTILVSSPAPQEGKTTIALNLAGSFAHSSKKTLLIDADLRKPRLHQVFGRDKEPGLANYLFGEFSYDKILTPTQTRNLFLITSGTIAANPSEILESEEMDQFLKKVRAEFDYIIVDSPPIVAVTDAEILARKVDGSILVVSANKTEGDLLERGLQLIKNDDSFFLGTVLNNFSVKPGYGGYYKYYYYYSPDGEKKFSKRKKNSKEAESKK